MGDDQHIALAKSGVPAWNNWRSENDRVAPNLTRADLSGMDLSGIDFRGVGLFKANLSGTKLIGANLRQARIVETNMEGADLSASHVYGTSVWNANLKNAIQNDLVITHPREAAVTVDNLEVAQFIYLIMRNEKIRDVIDTITSKVVLILGRFSPERKKILDSIRGRLRADGFVPVLFDFSGPINRNFTETVSTLARLAKYVIADLTDPSCVPHELYAVVPHVRVPVAPIIECGQNPYAMFSDLRASYHWILEPVEYSDESDVLSRVLPAILRTMEGKLREIQHGG